MNFRVIPFLVVTLLSIIFPYVVKAHEVYVLSPEQVQADLIPPPLNLFEIIVSHEYTFFLSALFSIILLVCVLGISVSRKVESWIDPILFKIKPYAGHIAQGALGLALLASAYNNALFGTELALPIVFGSYTLLFIIGLYVGGASLLFGIFPRVGGTIAALIYLCALTRVGFYMASYFTYFGEAFVVACFGGGYAWLSHHRVGSGNLIQAVQKRKHFILRIAFGISLIYAAFFAKFIHGTLALDTVTTYNLTQYFNFDPPFIVLGAFLIELTIAIFYLLGFEIRFTSIVFLAFLTLSLCFFGEAVWPHIILIGTAITMLVHGYDEYTVERLWYKSGEREPVL